MSSERTADSSGPDTAAPSGEETHPCQGRELAIWARRLTKVYHVYASPRERLKQMLWRGRRDFYR